MNRLLAAIASTGWWLIPMAIVAAVLGWETDWGRSLHVVPSEPPPIVPKPVAASVLPDYKVEGGVAGRPDTVARTLFNPTRRPAPVPVAEAPKPTIKRGQFTLTGTLVIDGKSTAYLRETAGGKSRRVLQGESINGMLVTEVKPDRVKLSLGDESEELVLKVASNPRPTQPPAAAPRAPGGPAAPGAPPAPPAVAPAPAATPGQPQPQDVGDVLGRRRQAARAAQGAATGGAAPVQGTGGNDPAWSDMYRQYQQRQR
jgi:hypothetical protein